MNEVRVALIGYGGIAKAHKKGYDILAEQKAPVKLVAICDINPNAFTSVSTINLGDAGNAGVSNIATYTDLDKMLAEVEFDMADICLPTYLHKEYASRMLKAGKHVLSEKPMALCAADCEEMVKVAKEENKRLMIGQCLRFEPSYVYLKKCIDEGTFGKLKTLSMERLSGAPIWGFENWFGDDKKSGGAILDLHIHDIDMARFLLGEPEKVSTVTADGWTRWSYCNTRLYYPDLIVSAIGSWNETRSTPFSMGFRARFEKAAVIMTMEGVKVCPDEGGVKPYAPELPGVAEQRGNRMAEEIRYIASLILDPTKTNDYNPPESAAKTVALVEKLRESAEKNGEILAFN